MKKNQREIREEKQEDEKEVKESIRKEGVEKRKRAKKVDKQARWSGLIMLVIIMMAGFLLWVAGEVKKNIGSEIMPREEQNIPMQNDEGEAKVIVR